MTKTNKTCKTETDVTSYLEGIASAERRKDCLALAGLMSRATGEKPKMWGTSIVGFGTHHYVYESGREGDTCTVGFASRKNDITIYGLSSFSGAAGMAAKLGKHGGGKGCLYVQRLSDIDEKILERWVAGAFAARQRRG